MPMVEEYFQSYDRLNGSIYGSRFQNGQWWYVATIAKNHRCIINRLFKTYTRLYPEHEIKLFEHEGLNYIDICFRINPEEYTYKKREMFKIYDTTANEFRFLMDAYKMDYCEFQVTDGGPDAEY